jgi:hypothetical protein
MKHVRIEAFFAVPCAPGANSQPAACTCRGRLRANPYAAPSLSGPAPVESCPGCGELLACRTAGAAAALRIVIANDLI